MTSVSPSASNAAKDGQDGTALRANGSTFRLDGPSHGYDPRVEAIRPDLADIELAHRHFAPHYAAATPRTGNVAVSPIRAEPSDKARLISELLYGESFGVLDFGGEWAWGYTLLDHCVGYVRAQDLAPRRRATHRLSADSCLSRTDGSTLDLPAGALFSGTADGDQLAGSDGAIAPGGAAPIHMAAPDPVQAAEAMLDAPYREGGRTRAGIDASGLIQRVLAVGGIDAPRDMDLQFARLPGDIAPDEPYERGDIIFLVDHAGVMANATDIIHASQAQGRVLCEPLTDLVARIEADGHRPAVSGRKRLLSA